MNIDHFYIYCLVFALIFEFSVNLFCLLPQNNAICCNRMGTRRKHFRGVDRIQNKFYSFRRISGETLIKVIKRSKLQYIKEID